MVSGVEDRADAPEPRPSARGERIIYAIRQFAIVAVVLLVFSALTDASRPDQAATRDIVESPFRWAILAWFVLLLLHAAAFDRSQMRAFQGTPFVLSAVIGLIVFVVGLATFDGGPAADRALFLFLSSLGAVVFWWPVLGICLLLWRLVNPGDQPPPADSI